jgi:hypothetical protein
MWKTPAVALDSASILSFPILNLNWIYPELPGENTIQVQAVKDVPAPAFGKAGAGESVTDVTFTCDAWRGTLCPMTSTLSFDASVWPWQLPSDQDCATTD